MILALKVRNSSPKLVKDHRGPLKKGTTINMLLLILLEKNRQKNIIRTSKSKFQDPRRYFRVGVECKHYDGSNWQLSPSNQELKQSFIGSMQTYLGNSLINSGINILDWRERS